MITRLLVPFFSALLLPLLVLFSPAEAADEPEIEISPIKVTLPDGLYFYQLYYGIYEFSPLFIVENGKFIDPYALAKKIGVKKFEERYVKGRSLNVYDGGKLLGVLSEVGLRKYEYISSDDGDYDMSVEGKYAGEPLRSASVRGFFYGLFDFELKDLKFHAMATPVEYKRTRKGGTLKYTLWDSWKAKYGVVEAVVGKARDNVSIKIAKEGKKLGAGVSWHFIYAEPVDLNGNGEKDLTGVFNIRFHDADGNSTSARVAFILWDSGAVEYVIDNTGDYYRFELGGYIDVDGDGLDELVVLVKDDLVYEHYDSQGHLWESVPEDAMRFMVLKRGRSGWEPVYRTIKVLGRF